MFTDDFHAYKNRVKQYAEKFPEMTEEATKTALIMPFLMLLGYDVFNPDEVIPEYVCDVAGKKGEKIDYVIMRDGEPVILIEAKRAGLKLQKQQQGQLYRYFSTNRCRLAILTNGNTYNFYSDINAPNVMDDEPFLSFTLTDDEEALFLPSLEQFQKSVFNIKDILSKAVFLKYVKVVEQTLCEDLLHPSDELVKYFLSRPEINTGNRITKQMIDKHREATAETMRKVMGITLSEEAPLPETVTAEPPAIQSPEVAKAIAYFKGICPDFDCTASKPYIVDCIHITSKGQLIGRLRIAVKHGRNRYDYTDYTNGGKLYFIAEITECEKIMKCKVTT